MQLRTSSLVMALVAGSSFHVAAAEGWGNDWEKAKVTASQGGKDLLVDFTGSDWCSWCIKMRDEVFSKPEFEAVGKDFVLVELDYPNDKSKLSAETQAQNEKLKGQFAIKGYPTIMLCDASGRPYARTGYQPGGPTLYVDHLAELRKVKTTRDTAFAAADGATGLEKAKLLAKGISALAPECLHPFYDATLAEIAQLDPTDTTGLVKREQQRTAFSQMEVKLGTVKTLDERMAVIEGFIAEQKPEGEMKQRILFTKSGAFFAAGKKPEAIALLDEIAAVDPGSDYGKRAVEVKTRLVAAAAKENKEAAK